MSSYESSPVDMMEGVKVNSSAPVSEGDLVKREEAHQQYMEKIEVPRNRGSLIPFTTWMGLGKSIKQLYGLPLHYLTNITPQQLDQKKVQLGGRIHAFGLGLGTPEHFVLSLYSRFDPSRIIELIYSFVYIKLGKFLS